MNHGNRLLSPVVLFLVIIGGCFAGPDDPEEAATEFTAPVEIAEGGEFETTTTLPPDDEGVLRVATLLPIESGRDEGEQWIKWKLAAPIPDPSEQYTRTYQLNIRSAEDDIFGLGWTIQQGEEPFASSFCLEDRPNCLDGIVPLGVDVGPAGDELIFRVPEGTFGDATGLEVGAFIQTWATADADVVTEDVGEGARAPLGMDERDPC